MSTAFDILQTLVNLVLAFSVFFLLRERRPLALLAHARQNPREGATAPWGSPGLRVADVGCGPADGQGVATAPTRLGLQPADTQAKPGDRLRPLHTTDTQAAPAPFASLGQNPKAPEGTMQISTRAGAIGETGVECLDTESPSPLGTGPTDRLRQATQLLDLGCSPEEIATRVAMPQGEVQVLWNLRRVQALHTTACTLSVAGSRE